MKEQCFLVRKDRRGRGVTVLNRDKTEVSRGVGGGGECMKMGHTCLERMSLKCRSIWNAKSWDYHDSVSVSEGVCLMMTRVAACVLDVSFVLAFSSNETQLNWRFVTDFMVNVAYSINVGEQMTHVGAVSTGMKFIVRTMWRYHSTKTAKIFWVGLTLYAAICGAP